ncbi:MAG: glycoside hydrolase [Paludibacter sp.]|nr:glycoside hydrolase [Paludibacter sp.]
MMKVTTLVFLFFLLACVDVTYANKLVFDYNDQHQTIHSFGASDCWRTQFIGKNWPLEKREKMADLLFSLKLDNKGNPEGIGLSLWRFNIGSGSLEAGDKSGVQSDWRRTECFLDEKGTWDWNKQEGQRWFLDAARKRGVPYTLGFSITAPYFMTKNGMTRASEKTPYANLREDCYDDYAAFMAIVSGKLKLDYLSPINEPQWEWVSEAQEGMQATNEECSRLIHELDKVMKDDKTKIVFGEAGDIRYLYRNGTNKPLRDNQIKEIFAPDGRCSVYGLKSVAPIVSGHSYWSTWPVDTLISTRKELWHSLKKDLPEGYEYWQTEYCPMEKNDDNPNGGGGRDMGMNTALYIARVIHHDLVVANAASWQSWTAFSEWDYKDALIFIDDGIKVQGAQNQKDKMLESCKYDGTFRASKYMWALGNYSRFIRPGMIRIGLISDDNYINAATDLMASAYFDPKSYTTVVVLINYSHDVKKLKLEFRNSCLTNTKNRFFMYETSENMNLGLKGITGNELEIPARSVITLVNDCKPKRK